MEAAAHEVELYGSSACIRGASFSHFSPIVESPLSLKEQIFGELTQEKGTQQNWQTINPLQVDTPHVVVEQFHPL